ncbi:hypothetical protein BJ165DRAFT_152708 [Panaeolus papilionaceus]|nr:hypothetical protein BJ165DRAFT_152708 [Panaeolus papilionaceus]
MLKVEIDWYSWFRILEEFHELVKKYDVNAGRSWRSKVSKMLSSGSGREKIGQIRNRFSSEHRSQAEALRRPIPRPESGSSNQHLNAPYDDQQRNNIASGSRSVVQQSPISIHSATQRSAPVDAQHATLAPPTIASELHPNTRSPDAEATDSESVLDTSDLEHRTSAFSSPTRETPPDNITPVETEIIPRYLDYEASILAVESDRRSNTTSSGSSQGSSGHHPGASSPGHTYSPRQNYPSSAQDLLRTLIGRPGPIVIHASGNSEGNQTRYIHRDS